jgi:aspartate aminotransferase
MSTVMTPVTHPVRLTERINRIEPSATMAVVAEADKLRQQGIDVVDFGAGEPHFSTPQHVKDAAIAAIQANFSKYTAVGGTTELKDAIIHRHAVDFDSDYRREEAAASVGGKHALFNVISVLVDHGDEVILPVPYWVSFKDMVRYVGGNCVLLQSDEAQGFRVTADMVARLVTPKTKLIILNSPSNPSGAVMSPEDMTEVVKLAHQRGIWVISDECYVYLNYSGKRFSVGSLREFRDRFMVVGSLSKTYAMTGWRLGFTLAPGGHHLRGSKAAEPVHVESDLDCAKGSGRGAERAAAMRRGHARGVHQAARSRGQGTAFHSWREMHAAGRRVLRLSQCFGIFRARRSELSL